MLHAHADLVLLPAPAGAPFPACGKPAAALFGSRIGFRGCYTAVLRDPPCSGDSLTRVQCPVACRSCLLGLPPLLCGLRCSLAHAHAAGVLGAEETAGEDNEVEEDRESLHRLCPTYAQVCRFCIAHQAPPAVLECSHHCIGRCSAALMHSHQALCCCCVVLLGRASMAQLTSEALIRRWRCEPCGQSCTGRTRAC